MSSPPEREGVQRPNRGCRSAGTPKKGDGGREDKRLNRGGRARSRMKGGKNEILKKKRQ